MARDSKPVVTREVEPGLRVYHVGPASKRPPLNGKVDHVRHAAQAIRDAVAARRH